MVPGVGAEGITGVFVVSFFFFLNGLILLNTSAGDGGGGGAAGGFCENAFAPVSIKPVINRAVTVFLRLDDLCR